MRKSFEDKKENFVEFEEHVLERELRSKKLDLNEIIESIGEILEQLIYIQEDVDK